MGSMTPKTTMNMCGTLGPYGIAATSARCSRLAIWYARYAYHRLPRGKAMPSAGKIRPKTMPPGSCTTPMTRPVRTSTLSKTLVNSPKKAFQSPGTHNATARGARFAAVPIMVNPPLPSGHRGDWQRGEECLRRCNPAENAALRFDHLERHLVELRKVRGDAVRQHQALEPAVVRLAHGGLHAYFSGDSGDDQALDAAVA